MSIYLTRNSFKFAEMFRFRWYVGIMCLCIDQSCIRIHKSFSKQTEHRDSCPEQSEFAQHHLRLNVTNPLSNYKLFWYLH